MSSEKQEVSFEQDLRAEESLSYLESIIAAMRAGSAKLAYDGQEVLLSPQGNVHTEIKARRKSKGASLSIELSWEPRRSPGERQPLLVRSIESDSETVLFDSRSPDGGHMGGTKGRRGMEDPFMEGAARKGGRRGESGVYRTSDVREGQGERGRDQFSTNRPGYGQSGSGDYMPPVSAQERADGRRQHTGMARQAENSGHRLREQTKGRSSLEDDIATVLSMYSYDEVYERAQLADIAGSDRMGKNALIQRLARRCSPEDLFTHQELYDRARNMNVEVESNLEQEELVRAIAQAVNDREDHALPVAANG